MPTKSLDLFYLYAHEDASLRNQLNNHLTLLQREGSIRAWYDRDINAGDAWAQEIDTHLKTAHIILLLVSPAFIASDYCYSIEMQEALKREEAGEAVIIPVLLRRCDWERAPFGKFQALPSNAKPVKAWSDRDAAFTDVVKGLRAVIDMLNGNTPAVTPQATTTRKRGAKVATESGEKTVVETSYIPNTPNTPAALRTSLKVEETTPESK